MAKKNYLDFISDVSTDPKLRKKVVAMIKKKGKGETPETLREKLGKEGYDVGLRNTKKILMILASMKADESTWDWGY